jgi:hypothetical protein
MLLKRVRVNRTQCGRRDQIHTIHAPRVGRPIFSVPVQRPANNTTQTTFIGVSALAEETGLSQGYVSKLLARGWPEDQIRVIAERGWIQAGAWEKRHREAAATHHGRLTPTFPATCQDFRLGCAALSRRLDGHLGLVR